MKILVVGDWHSELHEEAVYQTFLRLGHEVSRFAWHFYFKPVGFFHKLIRPIIKAQNKYMLGHIVDKLNKDFLEKAILEKPDLIFIYRGTHIYVKTLKHLRALLPLTILVGYNNDDPFSPLYPKWKWRHFLGCIPEYNLVLAYRLHNINEFKLAGARRVELLRSWFMPERNYPVQLTQQEYDAFGCDVVFIGHYENDGRLEYLEEVVRSGWKLRIFGPGYEWDRILQHSVVLKSQVPVRLVWGQDYNRAICGAKIALCFFSKLNRDTYTRRCFEIPASGTVLISEYSDDLASLYHADHEAFFFQNIEEMKKKISELLIDTLRHKQVAEAGMKRAWNDGYDVGSRMRQVLSWVSDIARNPE